MQPVQHTSSISAVETNTVYHQGSTLLHRHHLPPGPFSPSFLLAEKGSNGLQGQRHRSPILNTPIPIHFHSIAAFFAVPDSSGFRSTAANLAASSYIIPAAVNIPTKEPHSQSRTPARVLQDAGKALRSTTHLSPLPLHAISSVFRSALPSCLRRQPCATPIPTTSSRPRLVRTPIRSNPLQHRPAPSPPSRLPLQSGVPRKAPTASLRVPPMTSSSIEQRRLCTICAPILLNLSPALRLMLPLPVNPPPRS